MLFILYLHLPSLNNKIKNKDFIPKIKIISDIISLTQISQDRVFCTSCVWRHISILSSINYRFMRSSIVYNTPYWKVLLSEWMCWQSFYNLNFIQLDEDIKLRLLFYISVHKVWLKLHLPTTFKSKSFYVWNVRIQLIIPIKIKIITSKYSIGTPWDLNTSDCQIFKRILKYFTLWKLFHFKYLFKQVLSFMSKIKYPVFCSKWNSRNTIIYLYYNNFCFILI